jgi:hypothetical protein
VHLRRCCTCGRPACATLKGGERNPWCPCRRSRRSAPDRTLVGQHELQRVYIGCIGARLSAASSQHRRSAIERHTSLADAISAWHTKTTAVAESARSSRYFGGLYLRARQSRAGAGQAGNRRELPHWSELSVREATRCCRSDALRRPRHANLDCWHAAVGPLWSSTHGGARPL